MASLKKMRKKWYARIRIWDGSQQKDKLVPLRTDSKTTAHARLAAVTRVESDIKNGIEFSFPWLNDEGEFKIKRATLESTAKLYLKSRGTEGLSNGSLLRYRNSLENLICTVGPQFPIEAISVKHVELFKSYWASKHKMTGINIDLRHLKTFMKWCFDRELIHRIPKIVMVKIPISRPQYVPDTDYMKLIAVDEVELHYRESFDLYRSTGCRLSEPFTVDSMVTG